MGKKNNFGKGQTEVSNSSVNLTCDITCSSEEILI